MITARLHDIKLKYKTPSHSYMLKVNEWNLEQSSLSHCHHKAKQKYVQNIFSIAKCPITHVDPYIKCDLKQNANMFHQYWKMDS